MSTHNLCFEQKYEKYQNYLSENFHFLVVKFSVYLNRHVFVMFRKSGVRAMGVYRYSLAKLYCYIFSKVGMNYHQAVDILSQASL